MKTDNKTYAKQRLLDLYIDLFNKHRTVNEEEIFKQIEGYCVEVINESDTYYYKLNERYAKVKYPTFLGRMNKGEWTRWEALTLTREEMEVLRKRKISKGVISDRKRNSETEEDIIRFIKNDLPLNPRQLKYIESNAEFAEKLKKEGIC